MIGAGSQLAQLPEWTVQVGAAGVGAVLLYVGQIMIAWRKQTLEESTAASSTGLEIKKHRDGLTIELLQNARAELAAARSEIEGLRSELEAHLDELARLRRVEWRLAAYEEAMVHIEALLTAELEGGREAAENAARLFLARMEALKLKMGEEAQAEQRERAARKVIGSEAEQRKDGK